MTDYNPNIPQPTDNLSTSQGQMLNNFTKLDTIMGNDHYAFSDTSLGEEGLHKQVTYPAVKTVDPTVVSPSSETYTKTVSAKQELFFTNDTQVTQMTSFF